MTQTEEGYMFPFGDINEDALVDIDKGCVGEHMYTLCRKFENLNFKSFDNTEHNMTLIRKSTFTKVLIQVVSTTQMNNSTAM